MAAGDITDEPTVLIHGDAWKVADVMNDVAWCLTQNWHHETWKPSAALIHKTGKSSQFIGQKFDPEKIDLVEDGWTHDHCSICWWTLIESEDLENGTGYRNEWNAWLCCECYKQFVCDDILRLKTTRSEQP